MIVRVALGRLLLGSSLLLACQTGGDSRGRTIDECSTACWRIAGADCGDIGEECIDGCVRTDRPPPAECAAEQQSYFDCFWRAEIYTCDSEFGTLPTGCEAERSAARVCLGLTDASVEDAASDAGPNNAADASRDH